MSGKKPVDHRVKKELPESHANFNEANNAAIRAIEAYIEKDNELGKNQNLDLRTLISTKIEGWFGELPTRNVNVEQRVVQIDAVIVKTYHLPDLKVQITLDVDIPKADDLYQISHVGWDVQVNGNKCIRAEHTLQGNRAANLNSQDKSGHCFFLATGSEVGRPLPAERKKLPAFMDRLMESLGYVELD